METFGQSEDTVYARWCSEMFIKNLLKLAGAVRGDSLFFCTENVGYLFSQKAAIAKERACSF